MDRLRLMILAGADTVADLFRRRRQFSFGDVMARQCRTVHGDWQAILLSLIEPPQITPHPKVTGIARAFMAGLASDTPADIVVAPIAAFYRDASAAEILSFTDGLKNAPWPPHVTSKRHNDIGRALSVAVEPLSTRTRAALPQILKAIDTCLQDGTADVETLGAALRGMLPRPADYGEWSAAQAPYFAQIEARMDDPAWLHLRISMLHAYGDDPDENMALLNRALASP